MPVSLNRLCHIAFHVLEGQQLASELVQKFGFEPFATRVTTWSRQLVFRRGAAVFMVNEKLKSGWGEDPPAISTSCCKDKGILYDVNLQHTVSTASNICFETEDVPSASQRLQEQGCQILIPPTSIADENGYVTYTVVRSILGNVSHTLLDRKQYCGPFLPGFHVVERPPKEFEGVKKVTHFDHITYACPQGSSQVVFNWYKNCFGFQRFLIHQQDHAAEGYKIHGAGVGLRLTAMQCNKSSLTLHDHNCKFVLAESLPEQRKNQVDMFLEKHGGAGIQHVALYTTDIIGTAAAMAKSGANFVEPPLAYYTEKGKEQEIKQVRQDLRLLKHHGILLDAEVGTEIDTRSVLRGRRYLMQLFTKPLFPEATFFLELIERHGATGFGEGNIRALWQSVQNYIEQQ